MTLKTKYFFEIEVREGPSGFADDDSYTSQSYNNFDDCYEAMKAFNPQIRWPHFRCIKSVFICDSKGNRIKI